MTQHPTSNGLPTLGVCQWFHYEAYEDVEAALAAMDDLGVEHLRTGISWADYHRPGGRAWYDWQMDALAESGIDVLVSVWHTPPSRAEGGVCAGPPRRLEDYADFVEQMVTQYGHAFEALELWNEPNNLYKWNFRRFDPGWRKFAHMVGAAGERARRRGVKTVLGGIIPVDRDWLALMKDHDALRNMDVIAIHGFPNMWWEDAPCWDWASHWHGWGDKVGIVAEQAPGHRVWVTETGLATWDMGQERPARHDLQLQMLERAAAAPAERVYWYSLVDLHPERDAIEGFHVDENEYHMGLITHQGEKKPAYQRMKELIRTTA